MQEDGFFFKVLHFQTCNTSKQIHRTLQTNDMYGNAKKPWITNFLFKKFMYFFKKFVPSEFFNP